jgi:hypothetical protein
VADATRRTHACKMCPAQIRLRVLYCDLCRIDERRRRQREAARVRSAAKAAQRTATPAQSTCPRCGGMCEMGRRVCDACRIKRKKLMDAEKHRRNYPAILAARPPEVNACIDCQCSWIREAVKGPKPQRCPSCFKGWHKKQRSQWLANGAEANRRKSHRRRARMRGVPMETFTDREIFERDGWMCQIELHPVDRTAKWPHPLFPTLDHVIPISEGGPHTKANVRLACLRHNLRRGNRGGNEQLALIG